MGKVASAFPTLSALLVILLLSGSLAAAPAADTSASTNAADAGTAEPPGNAVQPGSAKPPDAGQPGNAVQPGKSEHYTLLRDVMKLELAGTASVRVQCTVHQKDTSSEATAVWDLEERRGAVRYLLLRKSGITKPAYSLFCSSEKLETKITQAGGVTTSEFSHYAFETRKCTATGEPDVHDANNPSPLASAGTKICALGTFTPVASKPSSGASISVRLSVLNSDTDTEGRRVLQQRYDVVPSTRLRSLDPLTPFISDALTALAAVAVSRAKEAGKEYARDFLTDTLCTRLTVREVLKLRESALGQAMRGLDPTKWAPDSPLLANTCKVLRAARLDDLAASSEVLWKALAADAVALALDIVHGRLEPSSGRSILTGVIGYAKKSALDALGGNTATTERDVQTLLLELGRIGLQNEDKWRCSLEVGFAVLHECMRDGECSADRLGRLLAEEREASLFADSKQDCMADAALKSWPELPGLLSRAVDVLRPPPGTSPNMTAVTALQVVLEVFDHALASKEIEDEKSYSAALTAATKPRPPPGGTTTTPECEVVNQALQDLKNLPRTSQTQALIDQAVDPLLKGADSCVNLDKAFTTNLRELKKLGEAKGMRSNARFARAMIRSLRAFLDMLVHDDGIMAVAEVSATLSNAVSEYCVGHAELAGNDKCDVPVRSANIERAFRVIGALVSYSASYRTAEGTDAAKLAELRAEQRKKAMEGLMDALTDRSNRDGDWIFSLGANTGLAASWNGPRRGVTGQDAQPKMNPLPLRLATGLSLQRLPRTWGFHAQLTLLDLAQFAAMRSDNDNIETAEADVRSAVLFGGDVGLLVGRPTFPIVLGAFAGYAPWLRFDEEHQRGAYVFGASAGIYVPFIDFN